MQIFKSAGRRALNGFCLVFKPCLLIAFIELLIHLQIGGRNYRGKLNMQSAMSFFDLTCFDMSALLQARNFLCPQMSLSEYLAGFLSHNFLARIGPFDLSVISRLAKEDDWVKAGIKNFINTKIYYHGIEHYEKEKLAGKPVLILGWHHGAFMFSGYAVVKLIPDIIRPNERLYPVQGNECVVISKNRLERAAQMMEIIKKNKPIFATFESKYGKRDNEVRIFGAKTYVSSSIIGYARQFKLTVIPMTIYMNDNKDVDVYFGSSLFAKGLLQINDREALKLLVDYFEEDLKRKNIFAFNPRALSNLRHSGDNFV